MNFYAKSQKKSFTLFSLAGICLLIVALLLAGTPLSASARSNADTSVGGTISVDTHWTISGSPYIVTGDLTINAGVTLTIDAGVEVRNSGMVGIIVNGTLVATGNSGAHVIFTSAAGTPAPGDWKGIYVADGGNASLDYTEIRYGGGSFWLSWPERHYGNLRKDATGTLTVTNSLITQSAACGLRFENASGTHTFTSTIISDNQNYGACLNGNTANTITFTSTTFSGNLPQSIITTPHSSGFSIGTGNTLDKAIYVTGGDIDVDSIWHPQLYLLDDVSVHAGNTLSLPAGVVVKFNGMTGLIVNGTLNATGTNSSHVVFTSNAVSPAPGDWKGIYVADGGNASLDYTEIRYGGGSFWLSWPERHYGNLRKDATGTLTVTNSLITQSAACGLRFENASGTHTFTSTIISDNQNYGACLNGTTSNTITFSNSTFTGNLPQSIVTTPHSSGFSIGTGNTLDKAIYVTGGDIDVNSSWSPQVYLLDDVSVHAGNTLSLPAGVVVKFNGMTGLIVNGTLNTSGSASLSVIFTSNAISPASGDWKGIYVADGGNASLDYTEIRYGGGDFWWGGGPGRHYGNLRKDASGTLTVTNSLITQSAACGLRFENASGTHTFTSTIISDNQNYGACLNGNTANTITFTSTTFSGNLPQSIVTTPHSSGFSIGTGNTLDKAIYVTGGTIDVNTTWCPQVYLLDDVSVNSGNTLALPAGVVVKFNGMTGLIVNGTLNSNGVDGSKVVFTSLKDDTRGDTNGDSGATTPAAGDWKGIYVADGGNASLDYTEIRYGGGSFWLSWPERHYGNLRKDATGTLTVTNSLITQSAACGLRFENASGTHTFTSTIISDNQNYGTCLNGTTSNTITFSNSTFTGNLPQSIITTPHSSGFSIGTGNTLDKAIYVTGGDIDVNSSWSPQVYLLDDVSVHAGQTLTIPEGAVVKFNGMTGLIVNGTLNATGTNSSLVVFTSGATSPASGDWKGIYVADGGTANLDYTEIHYGGGDFWWGGGPGRHYGNLRKDASGTLTVTNSLITQSAGNGLRIISSSATVQISNLHIFDNAGWGLLVENSSSNLMLASSLVDHNGAGGISLNNPGATVHVYSNSIVANTGVGIWLGGDTPAVIGGTDATGNNIYGNSSLQLQNTSVISVDASNNWWGINPPIYSGIAGNVDTSSPLSAPATNAPAYLADIAISGTGLPGTGLIGEAITYPLQIENNGPREAYYLKVSATLPDGVSMTGFNGTGWSCSQVDQQLTCVLAYLDSGAESALELTLVSPQTVHLVFDFTVSQANNDVVPANNVLSINTQVNTRIFLPLITR